MHEKKSVQENGTTEAIHRFNEATQRHDRATLADLAGLRPCIGEHPACTEWLAACRVVGLSGGGHGIATNATAYFALEDVIVMDDRAIVRWRCCRGGDEETSLRGVNLMRRRDGLNVEGIGYIKSR